MYQSIEVNAEPIQRTIAFLEAEEVGFNMGIWYEDMPEGLGLHCGAVCCMGGSMACANGLDPYLTGVDTLADLMGVDVDVASDLFHPKSLSPSNGNIHHWGISRGQAIFTLKGLIDGSIGYDQHSVCGFGYVEAEADVA